MQEAPTLSNGHAEPAAPVKAKKPRKVKAEDKAIPIVPTVPNLSGFYPTEFNVLVLPDDVDDVITTKGGVKLFKPVDTAEKEKYAGQRGRLIAVSPLAFSYEKWPAGAVPPQVGQKVIFAKYSGVRMESKKDGREYLLVKDKDIVCTEDE